MLRRLKLFLESLTVKKEVAIGPCCAVGCGGVRAFSALGLAGCVVSLMGIPLLLKDGGSVGTRALECPCNVLEGSYN